MSLRFVWFVSPSLCNHFVILSRGANERVDALHPVERILSRQYFFDLIFIGLPHRRAHPGQHGHRQFHRLRLSGEPPGGKIE
jgi:hypothetical protein